MNDTITEQELREWYRRHGKPGLARMLAAFGLDVVYDRASGDRLWYRDDAGVEHEVLDLVGSFGATLFGHNPPELVDELVRLARSEPPNLVQASIRGGAALLAQRLAEAGLRQKEGIVMNNPQRKLGGHRNAFRRQIKVLFR